MTDDPLRLEINLFGPFEVRLHGQALTGFTTDKVRALLAYLAVNAGEPYRRELLAGLLWPESPERLARASLRNALAVLRRLLREDEAAQPVLHATAQTVAFHRRGVCCVDVLQFVAAAERSDQSNTDVEPLQGALSCYRGPLSGWLHSGGCRAL